MDKKVEIKLKITESLSLFLEKNHPAFPYFKIIQKSLDARKANQGKTPIYLYRVLLSQNPIEDKKDQFEVKSKIKRDLKPVIIGAGPAGLFCALRLKDYGVESVIIERGESTKKRMLSIAKYWRRGELDTESNVCFGEGGAGLFSDGKIYTRVKSPYISYVINKFIEFGADPEIAYVSNPHLGSYKIRKIISRLSQDLISFGSEIKFEHKLENIKEVNNKGVELAFANGTSQKYPMVVLACGHSAESLYESIWKSINLSITPKPFALGFRIEHPRKYIDDLQFGQFSKDLGAATYRVKYFDKNIERGSYSFCMCPGGYVLSSATQKNSLVTNGMSNDSHNSPWSNSAIVTEISLKDFKSNNENPFEGFRFINQIEEKAFNSSKLNATGKELPALSLREYLSNSLDVSKPLPASSCPSRLFKTDISQFYPDFVNERLRNALRAIDNSKLKGFLLDEALLIAPETRTSSPITILRDKNSLESMSHPRIYPCGEGAGYAGGITSAAIDGIRVAEKIIENYLIT